MFSVQYEVEEEELERHTLWVSVWHNDRFGRNEFLGDVLIQLDNRALSEIEPQWYNLEQEAGVVRRSLVTYFFNYQTQNHDFSSILILACCTCGATDLLSTCLPVIA